MRGFQTPARVPRPHPCWSSFAPQAEAEGVAPPRVVPYECREATYEQFATVYK